MLSLVHRLVAVTPTRIKNFLHYALVKDLQTDIEQELLVKLGGSSISPLLKQVNFAPLLETPRFNFKLGTSGILGTWESQVQDEMLSQGPFGLFVDIGAANGLYVVGALTSGLAKRAVAYESLEISRESIAALAHGNSVKVDIRSEFGAESYDQLSRDLVPGEKTLILMDIEGGEVTLLDDEAISLLAQHDNLTLVVELHPHLAGQKEVEDLMLRLSKRFNTKALSAHARTLPNEIISHLGPRPDWEIYALLSEQRQIWMTWLVCTK